MASDTPDLVERLKAWPGRPNPSLTCSIRHIMDEAAARIEALEAELAEARALVEESIPLVEGITAQCTAAEASRDQALAELDATRRDLDRSRECANGLANDHAQALDERDRCKGALEQLSKPYFWEEDGFWPDASTPAHQGQELCRRRTIARETFASLDRGVE